MKQTTSQGGFVVIHMVQTFVVVRGALKQKDESVKASQ